MLKYGRILKTLIAKLAILWVFTLLISGCNKEFDAEDSRILSDIERRYCPDKRICIWDIKMNPKGRKMKLNGVTDLPAALASLQDSLLTNGFIVDTDHVTVYPDTTLQGALYALPKAAVLNIRSQPSFSAELSTQGLMGWPVRLKTRQGNWFLVQTQDGYIGWANKDALRLMEERELGEYINSPLFVIHDEKDPIRTSPDGPALQDAALGALVKTTRNQTETYQQIELPNGFTGWIRLEQLIPYPSYTRQTYDRQNYTSLALEWMGRPYQWGGTSSRSMDCSGFTKMTFHRLGYNFPRDASQQVFIGDTVTMDPDLPGVIPGDLLFFGTKGTDGMRDKITHVGIYLGNGRMIHASGQVQVQSLRKSDPDFAPERYQTFLIAKRIEAENLKSLPLVYE